MSIYCTTNTEKLHTNPQPAPQHPANSFLQHALDLAQLGFRVHPLKPGRKEPLLKKGWQDKATTDPQQIRVWWNWRPSANPGIVCGRESGIIVLDIDKRHGGDKSLAELEARHGELPITWTVQTRDGWHYYFRCPDDVTLRYALLARGIELLGEDRNLVGIGATRPARGDDPAHTYEWLDCQRPSDIPLAPLPRWVRVIASERGLVEPYVSTPIVQHTPEKSQVYPQVDPSPLGREKCLLKQGPYTCLDSTPLLEKIDIPAKIDKEAIKRLFSDWRVVRCVLDLLKLHHVRRLGQKFKCILHPEKNPSADIFQGKRDGEFLYADHHAEHHEGVGAKKGYTLTSVYYAKMTGMPVTTKLNGPSFITWGIRLLVDAGVLPAYPVKAPKLKGEFSHTEQVLYEGFQLLESVKWLYEIAPTPFTWEFAATWCGLPKSQVEQGMPKLIGKGYFRNVGDLSHGTALFVLGTRSLINRRARRAKAQAQRPPTRQSQAEALQDVQQDIEGMLDENAIKASVQVDPQGEDLWHCPACGMEYGANDFTLTCRYCPGESG
jgi:hypothetical protein